jgi:hypothetical protein
MNQRAHDMGGISRSTYDRYPWRRRVRSPVGRMAVLALWIAASAAVIAGLATGSMALLVPGIVAWIPAMGAVNVLGGGVNVIRGAELDERELRLREHAYALSHRTLSVVLVAAWVVAVALDSANGYVAALGGLAVAHIAAPSLVLAVQARLPEPDDRH